MESILINIIIYLAKTASQIFGGIFQVEFIEYFIHFHLNMGFDSQKMKMLKDENVERIWEFKFLTFLANITRWT